VEVKVKSGATPGKKFEWNRAASEEQIELLFKKMN